MNRLQAANKNEEAWTRMLAAQGSAKDMKKWAERWDKAAGGSSRKKSGKGLSDLISKFGGGF